MVAPIVVEISGDVDLRSARRDTDRAFKEISRDAERAADDISRSFRDVGRDLGDGLGDAASDADRAFDRMERSATDTADDIGRAFDDVGDGIDDEFESLARDIDRSLDRLGDSADDSADDIDQAFKGITADIERDFARLADDIEDELKSTGRGAARAADDIEQEFARAADRIPDEFDGLGADIAEEADFAGGIEQGFGAIDVSSAGDQIVDQLSGLAAVGGPIAGIGAAAGAVFGGEIADGFNRAFSRTRNQRLESLRTGLSAADLRPIGAAAGEAYAAGFGESLGQLGRTAAVLENTLSRVDDNLDLGEATQQAEALAEVFGVDIPTSARLARRFIANDLVNDTTEAFNLMAQTAQEFQIDFEEIFEVGDEFASVFGKLGVDGAQAFHIMGETVAQGLLPNIDRAAELFQEFNVRVSDQSTVDAFDKIGLSAERFQERLATGDDAAALAETAEAILEVGSAAERERLGVAFFGQAIEDASDPDAVLALLATADGIGEIGTAASDAAEQLADMEPALDQLKRGVGQAAEGFADLLITGEESTSFFGDFGDRVDLANRLLEDLGLKAPPATAGIENLTEALIGGGRATATWGDDIDSAAQELKDLDDVLSGFSDRFDADNIFRSLDDDIRRLIDNADEMTGATFSLANGFDTTTEAGSQAEAEFQRVAVNLDAMIQGFQEGTVTAGQLAGGQARAEAAIRQVAGQMGLTAAATQRLIDKYGSIPSEVTTEITVIDRARGTIDQIAARINAIPRSVSVSVNRSFRGFAHGGLADGFGVVGEAGPELIDFRTPTRVYSNSDSRRILDGDQGSSGPSFAQMVAAFTAALSGLPSGGNRTIENLTVGDGAVDLWRELDIADATYGPVNA